MHLFDTHAHLTDKAFKDDLEKVIDNALKADIERILCVCDDINYTEKFIELLENYDFIFGAVGIHPHEVEKGDLNKIPPLLSLKKTVALGEIGLDYHYLYEKSNKENEIKMQKELFKAQLKIAKEKNIPVIIHCREAWQDVMKIIEEEKINSGVFHCFSGNENELKWCLKKGFYISFAGPVTYPNANSLRKLAEITPVDRLLIETDCPYLTPQQFRGKRNEPAYVRFTAQKIAEIRKISVEEISQITFQNACRLFKVG